MSRGKKGTGDVWDVKGKDVPKGRLGRSLMMGLSDATPAEQKKEKRVRRAALDRLRATARNVDDPKDRKELWDLIPKIGFSGYPTWDEFTQARTRIDFLALARRGEYHAETNARRDRDAEVSERRTCRHSVDEYLGWQEKQGYAEDTTATAGSVLRRMLGVKDREDELFKDRRVASLVRSDSDQILDDLAESDRKGERVAKSTRAKNRKILRAWLNWELLRELDRAEEQQRQPLYSVNIFDERNSGYSSPRKDSEATVGDDSRRFEPDEMEALLNAASLMWRFILKVLRCLGLRPGEFIHIRWLEDVIPLPDGRGYEVRIEGGRGQDKRCPCRQCRTSKGWAPKNGPRRYVLDRTKDERGWITPACDALDAWIRVRRPDRGDFVFPDPDDHARPWTNQKLNEGLHALATRAGVTTGLFERGSKTVHSLRHTCASEMLERGISHPHAAYWIGDTLREFRKTYGKPTDEAMAAAIFAPSSTKGGPDA